jgi:hypothetical protein
VSQPLSGIIHGRTIELLADPGLADGQPVEVTIRPSPPSGTGAGIARTAGALHDDAEWDAIMEQIHEARRQERRPQGEVA